MKTFKQHILEKLKVSNTSRTNDLFKHLENVKDINQSNYGRLKYNYISSENDFDKFYAKLFDGCRHDSGDPIIWGEMLIAHYKALGIDPTTKTGCWSDSLDVDKAIKTVSLPTLKKGENI